MATAFTQAQLNALEEAIATGATAITYEGKRVEYRNLDEMMRIRDTMRAALGLNSQTSRYSLASYTKDSTTPPPRTNYSDFGQNTIG